jgi:hypothetical protein
MVNRLFAFCANYQANKPECLILQAQGPSGPGDGEIILGAGVMDQKVCEACPSIKLEVERPECVNCGGFIIREGPLEGGTAREYRYKCYKCNLTFSSPRKLE